MWLNLLFLGVASLSVGFILGWIVARPRRWDASTGHPQEPREDPAGFDSYARGA
jgi:hypothetical protein